MSEQPKGHVPEGLYAFPFAIGPDQEGASGMLLRDWFAGKALVSLVATECENNRSWQDGAAMAYRIADAMLAARGAQ